MNVRHYSPLLPPPFPGINQSFAPLVRFIASRETEATPVWVIRTECQLRRSDWLNLLADWQPETIYCYQLLRSPRIMPLR